MNLNQVILCGRLGADPEMRYTPNGVAVSNFSIAITSYIKKKDGEGFDDHTTWIDITCWGKTAERVKEYAGKGSEVLISGRMDTRNWEDDEGKKHYRTFVTAMSVQVGQGRKAEDEQPVKSPDKPTPDAPPAPPETGEEESDNLPF